MFKVNNKNARTASFPAFGLNTEIYSVRIIDAVRIIIRKTECINSRILVLSSLVILSRKHAQKDIDEAEYVLVYKWGPSDVYAEFKGTLKYRITPVGTYFAKLVLRYYFLFV